jgi:hypothetical protein
MKQNSKLAFGLCALLALCGCHNHDHDHEIPGIEPEPEKPVLTSATFVATITPQNVTRAADTTWDAYDAIGITGTSGSKAYQNVEYVTATADGSFAVVNTDEAIIYQDDDPVNFTAYYPWTAGATTSIKFSAANQSDQKSFDFLYATGTGSSAAPQVTLPFRHVMTKLSFTLKAGENITVEQLRALEMTLNGLVMEGEFNPLTGEVTLVTTSAAATDVAVGEDSPRQTSEDGTEVEYFLIVPPQQLDEPLQITFTIGDATYTATLTLPDDNSLTDGVEYEVSITVNQTGAVIDGCTIKDWEKTTLDDIVAE